MKQTITVPRPEEITSMAKLFTPTRSKHSLQRVFAVVPAKPEPKSIALEPVFRSALVPARRRKPAPPLPKLPNPQTLTLDQVEGVFSNLLQVSDFERVGTITLTLPFGMDHYLVNAATFKALAGREGDMLLRQAGDRWEIVEDDEPIDLGNRTQVFKLGKLQIYS